MLAVVCDHLISPNVLEISSIILNLYGFIRVLMGQQLEYELGVIGIEQQLRQMFEL